MNNNIEKVVFQELKNLNLEELMEFSNLYINNLILLKQNEYEIDNKIGFIINFIGNKNCTTDTLFLLHCIFLKNLSILKIMFENPKEEIINLLKTFESKKNKDELNLKKIKKYIKNVGSK